MLFRSRLVSGRSSVRIRVGASVLVWQIARKEAEEGATRSVALNEESPQPHRRRVICSLVGGHSRPAREISSEVEHYLDTVGVTGSIPVSPMPFGAQSRSDTGSSPVCSITFFVTRLVFETFFLWQTRFLSFSGHKGFRRARGLRHKRQQHRTFRARDCCRLGNSPVTITGEGNLPFSLYSHG